MSNIIANLTSDAYYNLDQLLILKKEGLLVIHFLFIGGTERIMAFDTQEEREGFFKTLIEKWGGEDKEVVWGKNADYTATIPYSFYEQGLKGDTD